MSKLDLKTFMLGVGFGLLVLVPVCALLVATFRPNYFETKVIRDLGFGVLWITGIILLLIERLIEFDVLKGIFKAKLSQPSDAASLAEAIPDSAGKP